MKENNERISIVTIVYNGVKTIEKTMMSILNQTYENVEYIIIDGGSNDGTLDLIKKYELKIKNGEFSNIYFMCISEKDNGIYDAMNKGIKLASGEWINFMNSGDYFESSYVLENIFGSVKQYDKATSVIYVDTLFLNMDGKIIKKKVIALKNFWKGICFLHQSCFVKTYIMKDYRFDTEYKIASDYNFLFRLYNEGFTFLYIPINISVFLIGGLSYNNYKGVIERYKIVYNANKKLIYRIYYIYLVYITIIQNIINNIIGYKNYSLLRKIKNNILIKYANIIANI